jgi:hypothetical protein
MRSDAYAQSSVTVSDGDAADLQSMRLAARITAHEPQKKVAFQKSLPGWIRP